jgi:hypothetical protein
LRIRFDTFCTVPVIASSAPPVRLKPAITLSRKDWHSYANRAVL